MTYAPKDGCWLSLGVHLVALMALRIDIKPDWLLKIILTYSVDYFETFSPVAQLNSIKILFSIAVKMTWPLLQLDVKNTFHYGNLKEVVYMKQPPEYVAQGENL